MPPSLFWMKKTKAGALRGVSEEKEEGRRALLVSREIRGGRKGEPLKGRNKRKALRGLKQKCRV